MKKRNMKTMAALLMTLSMAFGTSTAIMAAETPEQPAKVYGVENETGVIVTAYQVIKYNDAGYYVPVLEEGSISRDEDGNLNPTEDDILKLAARTNELGTPVTLTQTTEGGETYYTSDQLTAGSWMIIVKGSSNYVYNPAIVSVNVETDGNNGGSVDFDNDRWNTFMKKTEPEIEKEAVGDNINGVQYGDILEFKITTTIPSYAPNKTNIEYKITDTLKGLSLVVDESHQPSVTVGGQSDSTLTDAVKQALQDGSSTIELDLGSLMSGDKQWILEHGYEDLELTYFAKVTSKAALTVDELKNEAKLGYSTSDSTSSKEDETFHYTFGLDTNVTGSTGSDRVTGEFIKIDENGTVAYNQDKTDVVVTNGDVLSGAEFQIHIGSADSDDLFTDKTGKTTFTTDEKGRLAVVGLDDNVDYYLVETKAPAGYTLNETPTKVNIEAVYSEETGELVSYKVLMNDSLTGGYRWNGTSWEIDGSITDPMNPFGFKNTKFGELPSTGGMGTTIFTVAGSAIMVTAVGLYYTNRRRSSK